MIEFKQVNQRYNNGHEGLNSINLVLSKGEMVFLTGHSGAGKTTLLKLIAKLEQPNSGDICFDGQWLSKLKKRDIPAHRLKLGLIFQTPYLLNNKNVFENIALPLYLQGMSMSVVSKRVQTVLDWVGLSNKIKSMPLDLSSGEQQRVGIARAIVHKPDWVLADEPTGNLDPALSVEIMNIFMQLNQVGVGVLIATHELALIASMKYRIVQLKKGRLC